jgi:hypothetical protein
MELITQLVALVKAHPFYCYIGFNVLITPLPEPTPASNAFYTYFYRVTHLAAVNLNDAFNRRFPSAANLIPNVSRNGVLEK